MRIIAVANQKGGCGKTTISINLAACLAREGQRTLIVDMDPQGHCALGLAVPEEQIERSIADVLLQEGPTPEEAVDLGRVTWQISSNFDLIPSKLDLSRVDKKLVGVPGREQRLRFALDTVQHKYDFVIVDTPPTIGFLTQSALNAADELLVPVDTGYFALHGLSKQLDTIRQMRAETGRAMTLRILANLYDVRTKLGREILAELRKRHGDAMFTSFINFNTKLKESTSLGQPITEYDPSSSGCRDFVRLARELISLNAAAVQVSVPQPMSIPAASVRPSITTSVDSSTTFMQPASAPRHAPAEYVPSSVDTLTRPSLAASVISVEPSRTVDRSLLAQADALAENASKLLATTETLIGTGRLATTPRPIPTALDTQRKIEQLYGPRAVEDGILFVVRANGAHNVRVAGSFNNWNPDRTPMMHVDADTFQIKVPLPPGRYTYRYVIDGHWRNDPANHEVEMNPFGELNNVVVV